MQRALIFPGQGAQYVGMGMELAERYPVAREVLDEADDVLGMALSDIIVNGPDDELMRTDISQPAILTVSWMAYSILRHVVDPLPFAATAGLSLGEYTALAAAGSLTFADALRLVRLRGQAMQEAADATPGGMVALIGADEAAAQALCDAVAGDAVLQVANLNATGQVVISGSAAACERAVEAAKEHRIRRAMPLSVAGAFHSALMQPAADRLRAALADTPMHDAEVPVYANVTAEVVQDAGRIRELLVQQLTSPVRWAASCQAMYDAGIEQFWELGPGKTLCGMLARTVKDAQCGNLDKAEDVLRLAQKS